MLPSPGPLRAATMATSAMLPSGTGVFVPVNVPRVTLASIAPGVTAPERSANAKVPISSPDASFGR